MCAKPVCAVLPRKSRVAPDRLATTCNRVVAHREQHLRPTEKRTSARKDLSSAAAGSSAQSRAARHLRTAFVVFHLIVITAFATPANIFPLNALRNLLAPYALCIGLNEAWDTFAPNPKSSEQYVKAIVLTAGGDTRVYSFPRMEELSTLERYREERYRKFVESIVCKDCSGLWPDIEKAVARRKENSADSPAKVILVDFESSIDPLSGAIGDDAHAKPTVLSEQWIEPAEVR